MFYDRLEIYLKSALHNKVKKEKIALCCVTRNELITSFIAEVLIADTIGDIGR